MVLTWQLPAELLLVDFLYSSFMSHTHRKEIKNFHSWFVVVVVFVVCRIQILMYISTLNQIPGETFRGKIEQQIIHHELVSVFEFSSKNILIFSYISSFNRRDSNLTVPSH